MPHMVPSFRQKTQVRISVSDDRQIKTNKRVQSYVSVKRAHSSVFQNQFINYYILLADSVIVSEVQIPVYATLESLYSTIQ